MLYGIAVVCVGASAVSRLSGGSGLGGGDHVPSLLGVQCCEGSFFHVVLWIALFIVCTCGIWWPPLGVGMCSWYTKCGCNVQRRGTLSHRVLLRWRWLESRCLLIVLSDDSLLIRGVYAHVLKLVA